MNMESVQIGQYNTFSDWGMVPASPLTIAPFEVKTEYVEIPGFSRRYDFTEALQGSVPYGPAEGEWQFKIPGGNETLHQTVLQAIHGKRFIIEYNNELYIGRVTVDEWVNHRYPETLYAECTIAYSVDPYQT